MGPEAATVSRISRPVLLVPWPPLGGEGAGASWPLFRARRPQLRPHGSSRTRSMCPHRQCVSQRGSFFAVCFQKRAPKRDPGAGTHCPHLRAAHGASGQGWARLHTQMATEDQVAIESEFQMNKNHFFSSSIVIFGPHSHRNSVCLGFRFYRAPSSWLLNLAALGHSPRRQEAGGAWAAAPCL